MTFWRKESVKTDENHNCFESFCHIRILGYNYQGNGPSVNDVTSQERVKNFNITFNKFLHIKYDKGDKKLLKRMFDISLFDTRQQVFTT